MIFHIGVNQSFSSLDSQISSI